MTPAEALGMSKGQPVSRAGEFRVEGIVREDPARRPHRVLKAPLLLERGFKMNLEGGGR